MIFATLPSGDHGWGVVGDSLASALSALAPLTLVPKNTIPPSVPGPYLRTIGLNFERSAHPEATRYVAYAVFDEDLTARRLAAKARRRFDAIATASRWCESVLREAGINDVTTIHHGVDGTLFSQARALRTRMDARFVVFSGGKFEFRKGQDLVVRAFKAFSDRHEDVFLLVAWNNPWQRFALTMSRSPHYPLRRDNYASCDELLHNWLATTGLDVSRIQLLPLMAHADLAAIYGNTDVGLFPNRCEGATNLVMMEYMACGRPVIATDFSGHQDILNAGNSIRLREGRFDYSIEADEPAASWREPDIDELLHALEWAYSHRTDLENIGQQAARDLATWTWEHAARNFLKLLQP